MGRPLGSKTQVTMMRENFCLAFEKMGGLAGLIIWGNNNRSEFYKLYAKLAPKEIITEDKNRSHDQFVKWIQEQEDHEQKGIDEPLKLVESGVSIEGNP